MGEGEGAAKILNYLDPDLYVAANEEDLKKFLELYECAICYGVVLNPLECSTPTCSMFYCQSCIKGLQDKLECPRRCGSQKFDHPNKHLLRNLNECKFKCQYFPKCGEHIAYSRYQ